MSRYGWKPYVPVSKRRANAEKQMRKLEKSGVETKPVRPEGRPIARTFWGKKWCDHLESFSDYENRLPRGRTYLRNGSVCHLVIDEGKIEALVSGSALYTVKVRIKTLSSKKWETLEKRCAGQIGSLLELLQGKLSANVMSIVTDPESGLFPLQGEIDFQCSCPDWADMCKHVAAVLYGIGTRLDTEPELLFKLRGVDHQELIDLEIGAAIEKKGGRRMIADGEVADVFGIDLSEDASREACETTRRVADPVTATRAAANSPSFTGKTVAALRSKLGMSKAAFAALLGVSAVTIGNWEKNPGPLGLQSRSLSALNDAMKLTKQKSSRKKS